MKRPPMHKSGCRLFVLNWAFTILELLTVMTIIAVLAGLIVAGAGYAQQKAARDRARTEIEALSAALENFKADQGEYPVGASGTTAAVYRMNSSRLYAALTGRMYFYERDTNSTKHSDVPVYFEYKKDMVETSGSGIGASATNLCYLDPFGVAYFYRDGENGAAVNKGAFDLWSTGGTGTNSAATAGTTVAKWITNWN